MPNLPVAEKTSRMPAWLAPVREYFRETLGELRKVKWPTRGQVRNLTVVVLVVTLAMSVILGALDYGFELMFFGILSPEPSPVAVAVAVVIAIAIIAMVLFASRER